VLKPEAVGPVKVEDEIVGVYVEPVPVDEWEVLLVFAYGPVLYPGYDEELPVPEDGLAVDKGTLWDVVEEMIQLVCVAFVTVLLEVRSEELELSGPLSACHVMKVHQMGRGYTDFMLGVLVMLAVELVVAGVDNGLEMGRDDA
jgi:hypothetical protein